jgi:Electron transfer flavoprotein FAD-binding domain
MSSNFPKASSWKTPTKPWSPCMTRRLPTRFCSSPRLVSRSWEGASRPMRAQASYATSPRSRGPRPRACTSEAWPRKGSVPWAPWPSIPPTAPPSPKPNRREPTSWRRAHSSPRHAPWSCAARTRYRTQEPTWAVRRSSWVPDAASPMRTILGWHAIWPMPCTARSRARARSPRTRNGCPRTRIWECRAAWCRRKCTSPSASRARCSTWSACTMPTSSWPSTKTRTRPCSRKPTSALWATCTRPCRPSSRSFP